MPRPIDEMNCIRRLGEPYYPQTATQQPAAASATAVPATPANATPAAPVNATPVNATPAAPANATPVNATPAAPANATPATPATPANAASLNWLLDGYNYSNRSCLPPR